MINDYNRKLSVLFIYNIKWKNYLKIDFSLEWAMALQAMFLLMTLETY